MTYQTETEKLSASSEQLELSPDAVLDGKNQKIEKQRVGLLNAVAASRLDTMQEKVAWILNHYPGTRDSDIALQLRCWRQFESDLFYGDSIAVGGIHCWPIWRS